MHQIIEGLDNEVTFILFFITLLLAVVIPLYVLKPNRNIEEETREGDYPREGENNDTNRNTTQNQQTSQSTPPPGGTPMSMPMPMPSSEPGPSHSSSHICTDSLGREESATRDINTQGREEEVRDSHETTIAVRVLYHETYRQMNVSNNMKLKEFKEACFPEEFAADKSIRMIFAGKILQGDTFPLRYLGIMDGSVIHCVISEQNNSSGRSNEPATIPNDLDISDYFMHLVGITLIGTWTIFITSTNVMSATSIAILGFLTIFFIGLTIYS